MPNHASKLAIEYPDKLSRVMVLLKFFLGWLYVGIPHGICLFIYGFVAAIVIFIAFWAILFTGKYPRGMFDFVVGYLRWSMRVNAYMSCYMRDEYPPFSGSEGDYPASVSVEYPERLSRGLLLLKVFLGWIYVGIPHGIVLYLYGIAVSVVIFIAFLIILFTARYPKGLFNFVAGYMRWSMRVNVYLLLMRDEYPPFSTEE